MTLAHLPPTTLAAAQEQFAAALPSIDSVIRLACRSVPAAHRGDAIAEARAEAWATWYSLLRRGKDPLAVGAAGIAFHAARHVKNGRRIAGRGGPGRGKMDIHDRRAQRKGGFRIVGLTSDSDPDPEPPAETWKEWAAMTNRVTPADEAAFRVDFSDWLERLPARRRQIAGLLAEGHGTGDVARIVGVTPGAVSQGRGWLETSWEAFQSQAHAL
jgi:hypothetical protein